MSEKMVKTLRFDVRLIKQAEMAAKAENRSLNNWIETLMMREVRFDPLRRDQSEKGFADADDTPLPHRSSR